jgi:uncharacterized protein YjiK
MVRKENSINSKPMIKNKLKLKRNEKMARTKNRIKKMNFQTQNRNTIVISDEHKYIIEMHKRGRYIQDRKQLHQELIGHKENEILPRITGGGL